MISTCYSRALARCPGVIVLIVFLFSTTCLIYPLVTEKFPDFSDPQLGFEARGTPLAQRLTAWRNIIDSVSSKEKLVDNPLEYYYYQENEKKMNNNHTHSGKNKQKKHHNYKKHKKHEENVDVKVNDGKKGKMKHSQKHASKSKSKKYHEEEREDYNDVEELKHEYLSDSNDEFFCNTPSSAYARVVIDSRDTAQNLWSLDGIRGQCHLDATLRSSKYFSELCQRKLKKKKECCRSWSISNYILLLANKTSCSEITKHDLEYVKSILQPCSYFYRNKELTPECAEDLRCQRKVPSLCYEHNAAYNILHYILDNDFLVNIKKNDSFLRTTMVILPLAASSASLDYYKDISNYVLSHENVYVSGLQLGLKSTLFDKLLISDSLLVLFGFGFVTICIWFYTGSLLITLSTILVVIFSLGISYAIYTTLLKISLFPFMNILAIVVAVGIGSDDAFIFCKIWECNKRELNFKNNLLQLVHKTVIHAVPSMFVTTLTTAVAFFASIVSNVTAINCFSLFSGITVIVNFLLMITWLPASVIIAERFSIDRISPTNCIVRLCIAPLLLFVDRIIYLFTDLLVRLVISLKWLWLSILFSLGIGSCYVVFYNPGLRLPNSPDFQLFDSKHLFERYDLYYAKRFRFEQLELGDASEALPMRFVWGVLPVDNGNYLDPQSRGTLEFDKTFDISNQESQIWLNNFCENVRQQPFYRSTLGPLLPNCFIESLQPWMERHCEDPIDPKINYSPCCRDSKFPYKPEVLKLCTAEAIAEIHRTPSHLWNFKGSHGLRSVGLKFRRLENITDSGNETAPTEKIIPDVQVVIVEYDSNATFSLSFEQMDKFYNEVESWMQKQLQTAPPGMKNGWFVSYLEFYELQRTLYEGTIWAIVVSMGLALTVLALVTLNPFVSLFAILAVGGAIVVTVASLILMDWKLNVLESVAVSTAIGLAMDFSLHYSVGYRMSAEAHRLDRVKSDLKQMGGPTLMAGLTSAAAGALMLPSRVLPYIQIGIFLILIMGVSWLYATFFLCPLLSIAGPSGRFGQFSYGGIRRSVMRPTRRKRLEEKEIKDLQSCNGNHTISEEVAETPLSETSTV